MEMGKMLRKTTGFAAIDEGDIDTDSFRKSFVHEETGVKYLLFHFLVAERYHCLRENSKRKFVEGKQDSRWPVRPEQLSSTFLAMPLSDKMTMEDIGEQAEEEIIPLYMMTKRTRKGKIVATTTHAMPERINLYRGEVEDIGDEIRRLPSESVTMDHSYRLQLALRETVKKIWPSCLEEWHSSYHPEQKMNTPVLDRFLVRAVAEGSQEMLSKVFDWGLDLLADPPERLEYSLDSRNVLCAAERAGIKPWIIEKTRERLKRLFPSLPCSLAAPSALVVDERQVEFGRLLGEFESRRLLGYEGNGRSSVKDNKK